MRSSEALVVAALAVCIGCQAPPPKRAPDAFSVILVTLDTTRADRVGARGGSPSLTPNLDRAAAEGVKFTQAFSQVPLTLPSHSSIFTGRYPASHGVRHNGVYKLPDGEETLSERLTEQGFQTAAVVGAFVLNRGFGLEQGFATYDDIETFRYQGGRDNLYESHRSADEVNAAAFKWLEHRPAGRFFLWVHYYDPHFPYQVPEKAGRSLSGTGYERCISYVDAAFGELVDRLRKDGVLDDTVLVVAGDHGESLGEHREKTHGIFLYEGAMHVPLFIRAPGLVPAGRTVAEPVGLVDVAPTVLDLLHAPALAQAEGVSLVPRIDGQSAADAPVFAETLMPRIEFGWSELRMARNSRYKYIQAPRPELYDLREDPQEANNLAASKPAVVEELSGQLAAWVQRTVSPDSDGRAQRGVSPEELATLQSLGYLGGAGSAGATGGGALPDPKDRIDEGLQMYESRELLAAGRVDEALKIFDDVLRDNPGNHLARNSKIQALLRLKRHAEAEIEALAAVEFASRDAVDSAALTERARRTLASIYWIRGKNEQAEQQYKLAYELNRKDDHAAAFGGLLLGAAGGVEDAMRIVQDVLARSPNDGMAVAAKFELELAQGLRDEAHATSKRLAELKAGDADTLFKAGKLARDYKNPQLAVRLFELAAERKKDNPDILGYLGTSRLAVGDLDGAERALSQVERLRPRDPRTFFYLGNVALLRNDEPKARSLMDQCLKLDPNFVEARLNIARWLGDRGRLGEAVTVVQQAIERHPGDEQAKNLLRQLQTLASRVPPAAG